MMKCPNCGCDLEVEDDGQEMEGEYMDSQAPVEPLDKVVKQAIRSIEQLKALAKAKAKKPKQEM